MEVISLLVTPVLLFGTWLTGSLLERRHLESLRLLESGSRDVLAITIEDVPPEWTVESCELVIGNVVISQDYFKRFAAAMKGIVGGRIGVYEPLLERARREALLRMKGVAHARGYNTIINVRIETSPLARSRGDGKGTAGVEIMAFGTAIDVDYATRLQMTGTSA
ncbi:MAG: YbjQ family protein [Gemmatimonadota bacterium]|nr:YbjQ family protein [Gemmatimonadota bacterium]